MNDGLISKRYARALYEYAAEKGAETALYHSLQALSEVLRSIPRLRETLTAPMISDKYKRELLEKATGENPEQTYLDFVRLVITNRREALLREIALSYQTLYRKEKNISIVRITSATQMNDDALARIRKQVMQRTHGEVEFSNHIDTSIGGGFIFQLDDLRLDASVKGQLERLRRQLLQGGKEIC